MTYCRYSCLSIALAAAIFLAVGGLPSFAQEQGDSKGGERLWDLALGAGGYLEPEYYGAKDMHPCFLPVVKGKLQLGRVNFFADTIDGAGAGLELGESIPLSLSMGINIGKGRKSSDSSALDGLPEVKNAYRLFGNAELETPRFGTLSLEMTYLPTHVDYQAGRTNYDAILATASLSHEFHINRGIWFDAGIGIDWMNIDYAKANFGIIDATADKKPYSPGAGIRSVSASLNAICMFSPSFGICLYGSGEYLVGKAADSPVVDRAFQPTVGSFAFFRF